VLNTSTADQLRARVSRQTQTRKSAVHAELRRSIVELEYLPGSRLVEAEVAERFGMSKTPIREAILMLERDLLVEIVPYIGARVTWLSYKEYEQLVTLLDALEQPTLPTLAARITADEIAVLKKQVSELHRLLKSGDGPGYRDQVEALHDMLLAPIRSPHLTRMVGELSALSRRYGAAFTHRFTDTWELEFQTISDRVEGIAAVDPRQASRAVTRGHKDLLRLFRERAGDSKLASMLAPASSSQAD